ncbi:hypothetical protein [Sandaracinus amylolyticus]|uniref:hypothetical protein n=1 Tax=Sandaracinus amylolyticus TaxID=927083 RepID=UPI0012ECEE6E|nr:hypothetical protein [Sandaracinus amylolyticus]
MGRSTSRWSAVLGAALVGIAVPCAAHAEDAPEVDPESGHVSVSGGALAGDDAGSLAFRPLVRAEVAFNVAGPLAAGGFLQVAFADGGMSDAPAFGGGVLLTLRPDLPELGFVPHLEITGSRLQLPSRGDGLVDAWSAGIGGGIGVTIVTGVAVEARVHHGWYFGLPATSSLSESAWTFGGALTVDLP